MVISDRSAGTLGLSSSSLVCFAFLCEHKFNTEVLWSENLKTWDALVNAKQTLASHSHKHHQAVTIAVSAQWSGITLFG